MSGHNCSFWLVYFIDRWRACQESFLLLESREWGGRAMAGRLRTDSSSGHRCKDSAVIVPLCSGVERRKQEASLLPWAPQAKKGRKTLQSPRKRQKGWHGLMDFTAKSFAVAYIRIWNCLLRRRLRGNLIALYWKEVAARQESASAPC